MKNKFILKLILPVLLLLAFSLEAQTGLKITYSSGTTQDFVIADSGKLYFSGDQLMIQTAAAALPTSLPVSIIKKIVFSDALATQEVGLNKQNVQLYPNPSSNIIRIKAESKLLDVKIYSTTGQLVLSGKYKPDEDIDVSKLNAGVYLVQVNGVTIKLIKK